MRKIDDFLIIKIMILITILIICSFTMILVNEIANIEDSIKIECKNK